MEICKTSVNQILILIQTLIPKTIQKMKKFNIKRKSKRRKQRLTSMIFDHIFILIVNIFISKSLFIDLFDSVEYFLRFLVLIRHDGEGLFYSFLDHLNDHCNGAISFLLFVNIDSRVIESDCRSKLSDKLKRGTHILAHRSVMQSHFLNVVKLNLSSKSRRQFFKRNVFQFGYSLGHT